MHARATRSARRRGALGRRRQRAAPFILKRKLGLLEDNGHDVNSAWFRLAGGLDIEDWADPDDDGVLRAACPSAACAGSARTTCAAEGYWVWLIPLSSGPISIGIVADPRFHPWEEMNTLDGALEWIREHEPQLGESIDGRRDQVEDFLKVEDFSYGCKQVFSGAIAGAWSARPGPFLDPFYSPGSDFIAIANTLITDLVTRDLDGEDVTRARRGPRRLLPPGLSRRTSRSTKGSTSSGATRRS